MLYSVRILHRSRISPPGQRRMTTQTNTGTGAAVGRQSQIKNEVTYA